MCTGSPGFIPAARTARAEMTYTEFGQKLQNVFYFQKDTDWTFNDVSDLAAQLNSSWALHLDGMMSDQVNLFAVKVVNLGADDGVGTELFPTLPNAGTRLSPGLPTGTTVAVKFSSLYTGRSRRGRCYHIGLTEDMVTGNSLTTTMVGLMQTAYQNFFDDVTGGSVPCTHVIASFCGSGVWRSSALITPVSFYGVDADIDSQRRRLSGRGI